jgi:hypothetical protein
MPISESEETSAGGDCDGGKQRQAQMAARA